VTQKWRCSRSSRAFQRSPRAFARSLAGRTRRRLESRCRYLLPCKPSSAYALPLEEIKAAMDMCVIGLEENMKTQRGTSKIAEMQARGQAC
jgi:hypothetical protein